MPGTSWAALTTSVWKTDRRARSWWAGPSSRATPDGEAPFRKVVEGHLTDVSVGYDVIAYQRIRAGEVAVIEGVTYEGRCV